MLLNFLKCVIIFIMLFSFHNVFITGIYIPSSMQFLWSNLFNFYCYLVGFLLIEMQFKNFFYFLMFLKEKNIQLYDIVLTQMGTWVVYDREIVVNKFIFKDAFYIHLLEPQCRYSHIFFLIIINGFEILL